MTTRPERHDLTVPADPAMGATMRVWVAEAGRTLGLGEAAIEDLRLLASELFANGVTAGSHRLTVTLSGNGAGWELAAEGVGPLDADLGELPIGRLDLLRSLAEVEVGADGTVRCTGPASD
jgi:anti-sigma regulatory factor (Ser/Thr protein kinase)